MRPATILALSIASFGLLPLACTQNFDYFASSMGTGGGATGASSSSSSGTTSSSSSSGGTGCKADADCNDQNTCTTDTCNTATGKCINTAIPDGDEPGYTDTTADCKTEKCVGGMPTLVPADDVPASTSQCVQNSCDNGTVVMTDLSAGTSCGTGQVCDGAGNCGCAMTKDCGAPAVCTTVACMNKKCVVTPQSKGTTCNSGGGKVCDGAGACVECADNNNCTSGNCNTSTHTCGLAADGHSCSGDGQCQHGHCVGNICCESSCTGTCMSCSDALTSAGDGKCAAVMAGQSAPTGQCTASPPCGFTGKCAAGGMCANASNQTQCGGTCTNGTATLAGMCDGAGACAAGTAMCAPYTCNSGGTDCRTQCFSNGQCSTGYYCDAQNTQTCLAIPATCSDGMKDGTETGSDCGGSICPTRCPTGQGCSSGSDCASGMCKGNGLCN